MLKTKGERAASHPSPVGKAYATGHSSMVCRTLVVKYYCHIFLYLPVFLCTISLRTNYTSGCELFLIEVRIHN